MQISLLFPCLLELQFELATSVLSHKFQPEHAAFEFDTWTARDRVLVLRDLSFALVTFVNEDAGLQEDFKVRNTSSFTDA